MKNLIILFSFIFAISSHLIAQTIMNIHQSNGTVLQIPISTIDSITYTIGGSATYPSGSVFCNGLQTAVVDVINPITGKTWMDRNLGASRAAISSTDSLSFGDLYQWGRRADGHQCRNSDTSSVLSSTDQPNNGDFILGVAGSLYDWRSPHNNNLWQGVNGINNPCPNGYRLPTDTELDEERLSWSSNNSAGAFSSLKLPVGGYRVDSDGSLLGSGGGFYWSSTISYTNSYFISFSSASFITDFTRAGGLSVRCIKN